MWDVSYSEQVGPGEKAYTLSKITRDDGYGGSSTYLVPWTDDDDRDLVSVQDVQHDFYIADNIDMVIVDHASTDNKSDPYTFIDVEDTVRIPEVESLRVSSSRKDEEENLSLSDSKNKRDNVFEVSKEPKIDQGVEEFDLKLLYGHHRSIFIAFLVRLILVGHNVITVWRVTYAYNDNMYWLIAIANLFMLFEGTVVIIKNGGKEFSWWCPCFLVYLSSTIPAIWLLQLNQYDLFVTENKPVDETLDNEVWVIIVEESLVYLLVFSRWLLPREKLSRDVLSDLLIEFLAIASDIMELLAVFDEDKVRGNLNLTYAIMAVWSVSFIQFIPILMQRNRFRKVRNPNVECLTRYFDDKFVEIVVTCMSLFLQDLPFFILRMYIIFNLELITYSLIFFLLKNIVMFLLLSYRLLITLSQIPAYKGTATDKATNKDRRE